MFIFDMLHIPKSMVGCTYGDAFEYLINKNGSIPLGLYKEPNKTNGAPMQYVSINPDASTVLNAGDYIYILNTTEDDI